MKKFLKVVSAILIVCILLIGFYIWYDFFDVTGMRFYNGEHLNNIYFYNNGQMYLACEGGVFIAGGYNCDSATRKYRNVLSYTDDILGITEPVLIYEGSVEKIVPYGDLKALIITNDSELYDFKDMAVSKIAEDVVNAYRYNDTSDIFIINKERSLSVINSKGTTVIYNQVEDVKQYRDKIFVLLSDGCLYELKLDDNGNSVVSETLIYENVKDFDIHDTSVRYEEKYILDDPEAPKHPLINILSDSGDLFAKGAYNALKYNHYAYNESGEIKDPEPFILENWTKIGENVSDFSSSQMGTVMIYNDGSCSYYGFDVVYKDGNICTKTNLSIKSVVKADALYMLLHLEDEDGNHYFFGEYLGINNPFLRNAFLNHKLASIEYNPEKFYIP